MTLFSLLGSIVLLVVFIVPLCVTLLATRIRPEWSRKKLLLLSSGLIPILNVGILIFAFVGLVTSEIQRVDALDDAPQRAFFGLLFVFPVSSLFGLGFGFIAGLMALRLSRTK